MVSKEGIDKILKIIVCIEVLVLISLPIHVFRVENEITVKISSYEVDRVFYVHTRVYSYGKVWHFMGEHHFEVNGTYHIVYRRGLLQSMLLEATKIGS